MPGPERAASLYSLDQKNSLRFSHENPAILATYENYFEKPLSPVSHHLLHTDHDAWKMPGEAGVHKQKPPCTGTERFRYTVVLLVKARQGLFVFAAG